MESEPDPLKKKVDLAVENILDISKQLQNRLNVLQEKEKKWQELEEKIKYNASQAKTKIKLDIGGKIFSTSKSTLLAFEGSYFYVMLSSGHWKPDEDGTYFVDRNPKFFDVILDYMRTGKMDVTDYNKKELAQLQDDLDYYQIQLSTPIQPIFSIPSNILDNRMLSSLSSMFPPGVHREFKLVHDSTRGIEAHKFDLAVKGVGPTLIVIKSTLNYVFGAYVQDTWGQSGNWIKGSQDTFLFTFGNNTSFSPVKLLHNGVGNGIYITCCGAHLGNDLVAFCSHTCNPSVYTVVAPGYNAVSVDDKLLAGSQTYTPVLMEVFAVKDVMTQQ